jgi:hypothetical protein
LMPLNHGLTAAQKRRCSGTPGPDVLHMARDVSVMFDERSPWRIAAPSYTATGRGFRRMWPG